MLSDELVAIAIKALPMRLRKVFVMAHVQRKPLAQIAAELHITERQVARRHTRALIACRKALQVTEVPDQGGGTPRCF